MIDFRYHLVSIVSIFMALAVGIVLGAGPLKGDLGTRLTEQMTALRAEKAQLRSDLTAAGRDTAARDTFSAAVAPAVIKDRLTGKTVALVVAPGTDADLVKNTTASLVAAGAKVGSTITLTDAWADPAKRAFRNTLATQFSLPSPAPTPAGNPDQVAATVLAGAILDSRDHPTGSLSSVAGAALDGLHAGDLVNVAPAKIIPSSSVIFLGGPVKGSTQPDTDARLAAYVQLVGSLDAGGSGVVVASTVDDADLPMGLGTLVLALAQQYTGGAGQYGLAADAKAILPDLTVKK